MMIVLLVLAVVAAVAGFVALYIWTRRSEESIDYSETHPADERLRNTARAVAMATIGQITGSR